MPPASCCRGSTNSAARFPQIDLVISSGDRLVDLVREGIDCVVRAGAPKDSSLVARRLAVMPEVICASPAYLQRHGTPRHPDELLGHQAVGFFASSHDRRYPFELVVDGQVREFELGGWISASTTPRVTWPARCAAAA